MAKLKYKKNEDAYRLTLSEQEILVISKILSNTRLGSPDGTNEYERAAFDIVRAIEKNAPDLLDSSCMMIRMEVYASSDGITPESKIEDENAIIVLSSNRRTA